MAPPSQPSGTVTLPNPWLAVGVGAGLLLMQSLTRSLLLTECIVVVALLLALHYALRLTAAGSGPKGANRRMLVVMIGLWLLAHLLEILTLLSGADPLPRPSTVVLVIGSFPPLVLGYRLWRETAIYGHWSVKVRSALDTVLVSLGFVVLGWHIIVLSGADLGSDPRSHLLTSGIALSGGALAGSQVIRFSQRRDRGSALLAVAACLAGLGLLSMSLQSFGLDLRWLGGLLLSFGAVVLIWALADPSNTIPVHLEGGERDLMGALGFNLACWAFSMVALIRHPVTAMTAGLAVCSIIVIYLRVVLVRASEARMLGRLHDLAFTDPLTGLGNRRSLLAQLEKTQGWLITIDLDGFKEINDQYGHDAGDEVLRHFARRIAQLGPPRTHLARIGGDEFAVLCDGSAERAQELAEDILVEARDPRYARLSASVGLSRHERGADPKASLRDSDIAMQEAKRFGKDQLAVLTGSMVERRLRGLDLGGKLAESMGTVEVVYQPIVGLRADGGGHVVAAEALARWSHPEFGPVSPVEFIPIAEQQGLVARLGAVVLDQVIDQLLEWLQLGVPLQVSVNVSWLQLRDRNAVGHLAEQILRHPEVAEWLILEVTETVFTEDDVAVVAVGLLRELGLCIAVDDFGTGASNFRRLRTIPADVLKIDRSLLEGLAEDPEVMSMLATVVRLGSSLGMAVLVEGVEDRETAEIVANLGVDAAQGFYFARPMPGDQLPLPEELRRPWLRRREPRLVPRPR